MEPDFKGYATKAGLKCSDGRTITSQAFQHMDGKRVPLVWMHGHNTPDNILGHVILHAVEDGVRCEGFFNSTKQGQNSKDLVQHGDISSLSIYANQLVEKSKSVLHGIIREVSLVLSGANPGALIDNIAMEHSDGELTTLEDEAIIHTGLAIEFDPVEEDDEDEDEDEDDDEDVQHSSDNPTIGEIYDSMTEEQQAVLHYMVGAAVEMAQPDTASHSDGTAGEDNNNEGNLTHQEGSTGMGRNVFEDASKSKSKNGGERHYLTHADRDEILATAKKPGETLKSAIEGYALSHGIDDIDLLFPDARTVMDKPDWDKRRTEWVAGVLSGINKTPFSRIKSITADITHEEARAKGFIKGHLKKEQFFSLMKRTTAPATIYKKQKLDRDDILDITDFDVVAWLKIEMRFQLEEELARAILVGDGRSVDDEDKIPDPAGASSGNGVRSILNDDDLYAASVYVNVADNNSNYNEVVDAVIAARRLYKGSGQPTFYTTEPVLTNFLLLRDTTGRRIYRTVDDIAAELRVAAIVPCEALEDVADLLGIMVNLADYTIGADRGGEVNMFDDFDIDYNQFKYLIETRVSGALTKIRSALVLRSVSSGAGLVVPGSPTQDDGEVTVPTVTGVTYRVNAFTPGVTYNGSPVTTNMTVTNAHPVVLPDGGRVTISAAPASGSYYFANNVDDEWTFRFDA